MNNKRLIVLAMALFGLFAVPAANADVVVRYTTVDNGYSHHEPMSHGYGNGYGSRLYSNTSRVGNITYSNRSRYRDQCVDDRYYSAPRHYRNNYYYGHQNRYRNYRNHHDYQDNNQRRSGGIYRRDRQKHGYDRHHKYPDKQMHSSQGGRVHINIK